MNHRWRTGSLIAVIAVGLVVVAASWGLWPFNGGAERTDNAYVRGDVTLIAPKVAGYVSDILVGDYQRVHAGDPLVRLEAQDYTAASDRAQAEVAAAEAALANNRSRKLAQRAAIDQAKARLAATQALAGRARADHERALALVESGAVSVSARDLATADLSNTGANVAEASAALRVAEQQVATLAAEEEQLLANLAATRADLKSAELNVGYATIRAPVDGVTGERQVRVGQYVRAGTQLIALVPQQRFWVIANFKEKQLAHMAVGDPVDVWVDALPGQRIPGRVEGFAPASGSEFALVPPDNATGNFTKIARRFGVRIALNQGDADVLGRLRPGMSAEVAIRPSGDYRRGPAPFASASAGDAQGRTANAPNVNPGRYD
jgi:membrane fusion protein (multidrug efflux system)